MSSEEGKKQTGLPRMVATVVLVMLMLVSVLAVVLVALVWWSWRCPVLTNYSPPTHTHKCVTKSHLQRNAPTPPPLR